MLQFNLMKITLFLFFMIIFSSCAVNRKMMFENKKVAIDNNFSKKITVVFQDSRKDVLAGKEKVTFCGHMNSSAQIEYNIQTKSGKPLADEFSIFFVYLATKRGDLVISTIAVCISFKVFPNFFSKYFDLIES